jgi:hypothetical protein
LMHVKCIHELCSLLPHIPTYLHILYCYIHFLYFLGGFDDPQILVITRQNRDSLFCVFSTFTDLYGVKWTWDFLRIDIS